MSTAIQDTPVACAEHQTSQGCSPGEGGASGSSSGTPGPDPGGSSGDRPTSGRVFAMGADLSSVPEQVDDGAVFLDTDGRRLNLLELLGGHGFNYVRLRTFVDPLAEYGYASGSGACQPKAEAYNDLAHILEASQAVKAAGMGLLLDLHYSDTWADPGKQVIPASFRAARSIAELAELVRQYTTLVVDSLVRAGATPDMVQIGNEITAGFLIHEPTTQSDCYGNRSVVREGVNGSTQHWEDFTTLLAAGVEAVRDVDDRIEIVLHVESTARPLETIAWAQRVLDSGISFDVLGLSAYPEFQGPASGWPSSFQLLAERLPPRISFAVVEYGPEARLLNELLRGLPQGRGRGSFLWEPTLSGRWGRGAFDWSGERAQANDGAFSEFDQLRDEHPR